MKLKSKKIFIFFIIANLAVLSASVVMFVFILNKEQKFLTLKKQIAEQEMQLNDAESLKNLIKNTKEQQEYLAGLFINKDKITDFLSSIEALSKVSGAAINVISVDDKKDKITGDTIKIRFSATGSWAEVFRTVLLIDYFPAALSLSQLQISKGVPELNADKLNPERLWSANFEVVVMKIN